MDFRDSQTVREATGRRLSIIVGTVSTSSSSMILGLVSATNPPTRALSPGDSIRGATIVTPLDTLLTGQLRMAVDSAQPRVYPFSFCQPIGCFVRLGLTHGDLDAFRAGNVATIAIVPLPAPDQVVALGLSLTGFTAGFEALEAYNAEARVQMEALIGTPDTESTEATE